MKSEISHPLVTVHSTRLGKIPLLKSLFLNQNQAFYPGSCTFLTSVLTRVLLCHKKEYKTETQDRKTEDGIKKPASPSSLNL